MVSEYSVKVGRGRRDYDRTVGVHDRRDSSRLLEGSYKVLNAVIPAGERYGYLTLELPKLVELEDTTYDGNCVGCFEYFVAGPRNIHALSFRGIINYRCFPVVHFMPELIIS